MSLTAVGAIAWRASHRRSSVWSHRRLWAWSHRPSSAWSHQQTSGPV